MFADPMFTSALIAAIYLVGCLGCFLIGRLYERRQTRGQSLFQIAAENARQRRRFVSHQPGTHTGPPPAFRSSRPLFHR